MHGLHHFPGGGRQLDGDGADLGAPELLHIGAQAGDVDRLLPRGAGAEGDDQAHLPAFARSQAPGVARRRGGEGAIIRDRLRLRQDAPAHKTADIPLRKSGRSESLRRGDEADDLFVIDHGAVAMEFDFSDRGGAARPVEKLPGGIDLEGAQSEIEDSSSGMGRVITHGIGQIEAAAAGGGEVVPLQAVGEGFNGELQGEALPLHAGEGQAAAGQAGAAAGLVPAVERIVHGQERLDREAALVDLDHAVAVDEGLLAGVVDPDDGPVGLFSAAVTGIEPNRLFARQGAVKRVRSLKEAEIAAQCGGGDLLRGGRLLGGQGLEGEIVDPDAPLAAG